MQASLLKATSLDKLNIGQCKWNSEYRPNFLSVSNDGTTILWDKELGSRKYSPAWVRASTLTQLHSGNYRVDFSIGAMGNTQIGVGFMLQWNIGPDWGFFGYLGASISAWAYDPSTGDVVNNTNSIQGGLPKFTDGMSGTVTLELELRRQNSGKARFLVDQTYSHDIELPESSVVMLAGCFLKKNQHITLENFQRSK